jgi:leader peptidase (prepilin peptidase)/N-methyltransferase
MGYGDFKLLGALGAWMGLAGDSVVVLVSATGGAIVGGVMLWLQPRDARRASLRPYLALGGLAGCSSGARR